MIGRSGFVKGETMSDLFKKLNNDTIAGIIFVAKLGVVFLVKKWVETFSETVFAALKKRKGTMLVPAFVLVVWFPVGSIIEAYFLKQDGLHGLWTIVVDAYLTYFFCVLLRVFFKRVKSEQKVVS